MLRKRITSLALVSSLAVFGFACAEPADDPALEEPAETPPAEGDDAETPPAEGEDG